MDLNADTVMEDREDREDMEDMGTSTVDTGIMERAKSHQNSISKK